MQPTMNKCRKRLALVWLVGSGLLSLVVVLQTMGGKYADYTEEVWDWFIPNFLPTLTLMIGVFVTQAAGRAAQAELVNRFLFRLAFGLSLVYLFLLALPIFALPFVRTEPKEMVAFLSQSDLWLRPAQGLVTASLGGFFVSRAGSD